ncbi:hypothetical protein FRC11_003049, partial [Ceratobasidium sp. 423]
MGTVRGKGSAGWVAPMMLAGQKRGDARALAGEANGGEGGDGLKGSHSARVTRSGTSSRNGSKPPTPSRASTNSSVLQGQTPVSSPNRAGSIPSPHHAGSIPSPQRTGSTASSNRGPAISSPNRPVRHPFLAGGRRRSVSTEDERALHRYRSADALRKILDDAAAKRRLEEEQREEERRLEEERGQKLDDAEQERGRKPLARPTWSVIPRRGTTVAVETVAPAGTVSIEGITGTGGGGTRASRGVVGRQVDPLVLPGEFWIGPATAEPGSMRQDTLTARRDTLTPGRQETLTPARRDIVTARQDSVTARRDTLTPDSPTRQRSQSMGPVTRFSSLLPKISVFGKASGVGEPPPMVDKGKGKANEE